MKRNFYYGVPFLALLVGGSFSLKYFAELKYQFARTKKLTAEEAQLLVPKEQAEIFALKMKAPEDAPTVENEFEKLKQMDIDNWVNIRGPRPWEDSKSVQQLQKQSPSHLKT